MYAIACTCAYGISAYYVLDSHFSVCRFYHAGRLVVIGYAFLNDGFCFMWKPGIFLKQYVSCLTVDECDSRSCLVNLYNKVGRGVFECGSGLVLSYLYILFGIYTYTG